MILCTPIFPTFELTSTKCLTKHDSLLSSRDSLLVQKPALNDDTSESFIENHRAVQRAPFPVALAECY